MNNHWFSKGGLISESFSIWLKSPNMFAKSHPSALSTYREDAQESDLTPIFGYLSQSEKLSQIKPP